MAVENVAVIKPKKFVQIGVAALERESVLPASFLRIPGQTFVGAVGDSVSYTLPAIATARDYTWRTRVDPIVLDKITRTQGSIKIGEHVYSGIAVTDEQLTMDIQNVASEVVLPMATAVGARLESKVIGALEAEPFKITNLNAKTADDPFDFAIRAGQRLNAQGTPRQGRFLLVGSNVEAWLMKSSSLLAYDSAQALTAYREARFGRIAGFDVVGSSLIDPNAIFALHSSALFVASLAPAVPAGVPFSASASANGYGMRVIRDFNTSYLQDQIVLSTFFGVGGIRDEWALDANGAPILDADGFATLTDKNVRGAKGVFTPAA